jgi:hypothetical protein
MEQLDNGGPRVDWTTRCKKIYNKDFNIPLPALACLLYCMTCSELVPERAAGDNVTD